MKQKRTYAPPPEIDTALLRSDANRRRVALVTGGCSTYILGQRGGEEAIVCLCCGLGSNHPGDISERYCGFCKTFHSEFLDEAPHAGH